MVFQLDPSLDLREREGQTTIDQQWISSVRIQPIPTSSTGRATLPLRTAWLEPSARTLLTTEEEGLYITNKTADPIWVRWSAL
jgi:hypothetical protein